MSAVDLAREHCVACTPETPRLSVEEAKALREGFDPDWEITQASLQRTLRFRDFAAAFALATRIALLAERERHHPDLEVGWGRLVVRLTTHAIGGLSRNDLVMAARIDRLASDARIRRPPGAD